MIDRELFFTAHDKEIIEAAFDIIGRKVWQNSEDHGFHESNRPFSEEVALFHSEVSEALEEWRAGREFDEIHYTQKFHHGLIDKTVEIPAEEFKPNGKRNKPEGIGPEFADVFIRMFESVFHHKIPLAHSLFIKHEYNVDRPYRHGKIA